MLSVWLIPIAFFSIFNSMRFIAEHYDTPWDSGQLSGTRTVISNRAHSFFWNNINYHIGHHVYPAVPWYNLPRLHEAMLPTIERAGARVDRSYLAVFWEACVTGPETIERNRQRQARRVGSDTTDGLRDTATGRGDQEARSA